MGWFEHHHRWRDKTGMITLKESGIAQGGLIVEDCRCGAVRTIEFRPGQTPIVRIAASPSEEK
jgi:hypothetical protein